MKLMLEQLKQQDPLSPMDNSQFLQQTSMMTMVEKLTKMASLMEQSNNSMLTLREYEALVGRTASYDMQKKDEMTGEVTHEKNRESSTPYTSIKEKSTSASRANKRQSPANGSRVWNRKACPETVWTTA